MANAGREAVRREEETSPDSHSALDEVSRKTLKELFWIFWVEIDMPLLL